MKKGWNKVVKCMNINIKIQINIESLLTYLNILVVQQIETSNFVMVVGIKHIFKGSKN